MRLLGFFISLLLSTFSVGAIGQTQSFGPDGQLFHIGGDDKEVQKAFLMSQREWREDMIAEGGQIRVEIYRQSLETPSESRLLNYEVWCDSYPFEDGPERHWGGPKFVTISYPDGGTYAYVEDNGKFTYMALGEDDMRQQHIPSVAAPPREQWLEYNLWWAVCGQVATATKYVDDKWVGGSPIFRKYVWNPPSRLTNEVAAQAKQSEPKSPEIQRVAASIDDAKGAETEEIDLVQAGKLFEIPIRINGAITLPFIIDSGATDVQIPLDVFTTLIRANTIQKSDIVGEQTYVLADGSENKAAKFLIRELKIGRYTLHNVPGSVGSEKGALLLGQSFLSNFDSWTLDNKRHVLRLAGKTSEAGDELATPPSVDHQVATLSAPPLPRHEVPTSKTAVVCGKPVEYAINQTGDRIGLLGVWTGNWSNAGRLCGALIVQAIDSQGTADIVYVYGPARPGGGFPWKQQHRVGLMSNGILSFKDDQGSTFRFRPSRSDELDAIFQSQTGRLTATFQRSR